MGIHGITKFRCEDSMMVAKHPSLCWVSWTHLFLISSWCFWNSREGTWTWGGGLLRTSFAVLIFRWFLIGGEERPFGGLSEWFCLFLWDVSVELIIAIFGVILGRSSEFICWFWNPNGCEARSIVNLSLGGLINFPVRRWRVKPTFMQSFFNDNRAKVAFKLCLKPDNYGIIIYGIIQSFPIKTLPENF